MTHTPRTDECAARIDQSNFADQWRDDLEGHAWVPADFARELEREINEAHAVLDNDPSQIIRNAEQEYPEGREPRELTLAERIQALCKYAADWKRWTEEKERELAKAQNWQDIKVTKDGETHPLGRLIEMLEHELAEVKKAAVCIHNGKAASAEGWALLYDDAIEQRDALAACLNHLRDRDWFRDGVTGREVICGLDPDKVRAALDLLKISKHLTP